MGDKTGIEWTEATWNPVTGCDMVSTGCDHCYAETIAHRFAGTKAYPNGFQVTLRPERLDQPLRWRRPRRIFVNSMSDLFHDSVPDDYIAQVFAVMAVARQHTFQLLTKRHARMKSLIGRGLLDMVDDVAAGMGFKLDLWPLPNLWIGVSTEDQQWADIRIPALLDTPAAVRFISAEPLLGPINVSGFLCDMPGPVSCGEHMQCCEHCDPLTGKRGGLDWVIVGGESGLGARPMHPDWAERLQQQCESAGIPFLFKQWGEWTPMAPIVRGKFDFSNGITMTDDGNTYQRGDLDYPDGPRRGEAMRADFPHHHPTSMYRVGKKRAGRELYHDGRTWDQYPRLVAP